MARFEPAVDSIRLGELLLREHRKRNCSKEGLIQWIKIPGAAKDALILLGLWNG